MSRKNNLEAIEMQLAEIQAAFIDIDADHLEEVERMIREVRRSCDHGMQALHQVHQKLGLYVKDSK